MGAKQPTDERDIETIQKVIESAPGMLRYMGHHMGNSLGAARNALTLLREDFPEHDMARIAAEAVEHTIDDLRAAGILKG